VSSEQDVASDNGFILGDKTGWQTHVQLIGSEGRLWIFARREAHCSHHQGKLEEVVGQAIVVQSHESAKASRLD
jgi:hypothetical protein